MRILVIEDEVELCEDIAKGLRLHGYAVDTSYDGEDGHEKLYINNYDIAILDLNLPKKDGFQVLKEIHMEKPQLKFIILSARDSVVDKVTGLDLGANDYIIKPFHFDELLARIRGLLRLNVVVEDVFIRCGEITIDTNKKVVTIQNNSVQLSAKEYELLYYLIKNKNTIVSQENLLEHIWDDSVDYFTATVRVHISNLRKKLVKYGVKKDTIKSVVGRGYIVEDDF